jgi:hypothetical protein
MNSQRIGIYRLTNRGILYYINVIDIRLHETRMIEKPVISKRAQTAGWKLIVA